MQVETYEIQETSVDGIESDALALELIEELNLVGQITPDNKRLSFDVLNEMQTFIINQLFPSSSPIEEYKSGGIPLRVLETYKEHKDSFLNWTVRYAPPAKIIDPILLADSTDYTHTAQGRISSKNIFLIARWGDALLPWDELFERAQKVCRDLMVKQLCAIKASVTSDLEMLMDGHNPDIDQASSYTPIYNARRGW